MNKFQEELIIKEKNNPSDVHAAPKSPLEGGPRFCGGGVYLSTDHLFQLDILGHCEIDGKKYRDKLFSKCYSTAWINCEDDQLLASSEKGYCVLIPID